VGAVGESKVSAEALVKAIRLPGFISTFAAFNPAIQPNRGRDHAHPNRVRGASDVRVHPTTGGARANTAPAQHAIHAAPDLPAGCDVGGAQWLRGGHAPHVRCGAGTCRGFLHEGVVLR